MNNKSTNDRLIQKIAIVTGASNGIGRAIAEELCTNFKVIGVGRSHDSLQKTAAICENKQGIPMESKVCDLSTQEATTNLIDSIGKKFGRIDLLINNAGIGITQPLSDMTEEDWDEIMNLNLKVPFLLCKKSIPLMTEVGGGNIVNVASLAGIQGTPFVGAYSASKAGLISLTETLAREVGRLNIRVNCVCPGAVDTNMLDKGLDSLSSLTGQTTEAIKSNFLNMSAMGRFAERKEIAKAVSFLSSDNASGISGAILPVTAGQFPL